MLNIIKTHRIAALAGSVALSMLAIPAAQAQDAAGRPAQGATLSCCKCLGESSTADVSTGKAGWTVTLPNGSTTGVVPASNAAWTAVGQAQWVGPAGAPTAPGTYRYTVTLDLRNCTIPSDTKLAISYRADNRAVVKINGVQVATQAGTLDYGFLPGSLTNYIHSFPAGTTGVQTITFEVFNRESVTGLAARVVAERKCTDRPER